MNKLITLFGVLLLTTSCLKFDGELNVKESVQMKERYGFLNLKTRLITVKPGEYQASLKAKSDKNFLLRLERNGKEDLEIPLKAEKDLNVPENGKFTINGVKIDQPFNVVGVVNTERERGPIQYGSESCTWESTRTVCERVCDRSTGKCSRACRDITVTTSGYRDISFHSVTTTRDVELEISKGNSSSVAAEFKGRDISVVTVNDYTGPCRIH